MNYANVHKLSHTLKVDLQYIFSVLKHASALNYLKVDLALEVELAWLGVCSNSSSTCTNLGNDFFLCP